MSRIDNVIDEVIDLFIELGANEEQLDFKVAYVSALNGTASLDPDISTQSESYDDIFNDVGMTEEEVIACNFGVEEAMGVGEEDNLYV